MNQKGFTFIEILVVTTIIGILATIGLTSYQVANKKARDGKRRADIEQIRSALEMCRADNNVYPDDISAGVVCGNSYLSPIPHDPKCPAGVCEGVFEDYVYTPAVDFLSYSLCTSLELEGSVCKTQP